MPSHKPDASQAWTAETARRWYILFLAAAGLAAYLNSFSGVFLFDDEHAILHNAIVRGELSSWRNVLSQQRPLALLTLAANYRIGVFNVCGYHLVNLAIHLSAGLVLYDLVRRTLLLPALAPRFARAAPELALGMALLWLVHPLQTESVTYICQRAEALMGLFYLLTVYCLLRGDVAPRGHIWDVVAVLCCILGMASKEVMVTAPLLAILYDRAFLSPSWLALLRRRWVFYLALACSWGVLAVSFRAAFHTSEPAVVFQNEARVTDAAAPSPEKITGGFGMKGLTPTLYALSQPGVILHYLRLAVWPDGLCLDYSWPVAGSVSEIAPASCVLLTLLGATLWACWRSPPLAFVGAWFFLILAPTSSIMPINDLAVEHRMYLSLASVAVLVVLGGYALGPLAAGRLGIDRRLLPWLGGGLLVIAILSLGLRTRLRNADYRSDLTMWADVVAQRPANARGHNNLGRALMDRGRLRDAAHEFRLAIRLRPEYDLSHSNLGTVLLRVGDPVSAIPEFETAVRLNPWNQRAQNNLGNLLMGQGQLSRAAEHLRQAMQIDPHDPLAPLNLGMTLQLQGEWAEAADAYRRVLVLKPEDMDAHRGLAFVLHRLGQTAEGRSEYQESLRLDPTWPQTSLQMAWDLATNADPRRRVGTVAVQLATQVVQAVGHTNPQALNVLAAAYAEAGSFKEAAATARQAAEIADTQNQTDLAAAIRDRLRGYENNKPYRQPPRSRVGMPAGVSGRG
ncbi:MAG TPA: tetratricopeptide repeat protein [Gemmataceae bacterium]|nr:tetratricopeptide repeat protein [Gemmataceae bacterium]